MRMFFLCWILTSGISEKSVSYLKDEIHSTDFLERFCS